MDPVTIGGGTVSHAATDPYYLRQGAIQYEVGTPPIAQAIGWTGAIEYMESLEMNHVLEHAETMTPFAVHALHGVEGLTIWGDPSKPGGAGGLVSFSLSNVPPAQIGTACGMLGVAIRSGTAGSQQNAPEHEPQRPILGRIGNQPLGCIRRLVHLVDGLGLKQYISRKGGVEWNLPLHDSTRQVRHASTQQRPEAQ